MIELVLSGRPVPKGRPRHGGGRTWTPARTAAAEDAIAWLCHAHRVRFADQPVRVELVFYGAHPLADVDNLAKLVLDGLQKGRAIENDRQVVNLLVARVDDDPDPRTVIRLGTLEAAA